MWNYLSNILIWAWVLKHNSPGLNCVMLPVYILYGCPMLPYPGIPASHCMHKSSSSMPMMTSLTPRLSLVVNKVGHGASSIAPVSTTPAAIFSPTLTSPHIVGYVFGRFGILGDGSAGWRSEASPRKRFGYMCCGACSS